MAFIIGRRTTGSSWVIYAPCPVAPAENEFSFGYASCYSLLETHSVVTVIMAQTVLMVFKTRRNCSLPTPTPGCRLQKLSRMFQGWCFGSQICCLDRWMDGYLMREVKVVRVRVPYCNRGRVQICLPPWLWFQSLCVLFLRKDHVSCPAYISLTSFYENGEWFGIDLAHWEWFATPLDHENL